MKRSIFNRYFCLSIILMLLCTASIGATLIIASSKLYKDNKAHELKSTALEIVLETKNAYVGDEYDKHKLDKIYYELSLSNKIDCALFSSDGKAIGQMEKSGNPDKIYNIYCNLPQKYIELCQNGENFFVGDLGEVYNDIRCSYIYEFTIAGENLYMVSSSPANELNDFSMNMFVIFIICTVIILGGISFLLFALTRHIFKPIEEMTIIARKYGKGDFSEKMNTDNDDEIGCLATSLNEMASSIAENENIRKSFVANVSHELRTPMTTIGGFVDGILDGTIEKSQRNHYLYLVSREVRRLTRLIRSMLNISKFETGEMDINHESMDLTQVAIKTCLMFENKIEEKQVDIVGLDADACFINADIDLIQQVFYNILENAVKFVDDGGRITFDISLKEDRARVSIKNTGNGLKDSEIPRVFDKFYKTDESRGKDKSGVGLGLSIVKFIIDLHKGNIIVKSVEEEYTEFIFELPKTND